VSSIGAAPGTLPATTTGRASVGALAWRGCLRVAPSLWVAGLLLGAWLIAVEVVDREFVIPTPTSVWEAATEVWRSGRLWDDITTTLRRIVAAFALALVVGAAVGILVGRVRTIRLILRPILAFSFPTPKVAIYPALVVLLGFGSSSKIAFGFAEAVFPIILTTAAAASQVDERMLWSARALGTNDVRSFIKVVLPGALPGILTGARVGLIGAIIGVFLGEMIVGTNGLGQLMVLGWRRLRTPDMYVAIVTVSLLGLILDRCFLAFRNRLLVWSHEGSDGSGG